MSKTKQRCHRFGALLPNLIDKILHLELFCPVKKKPWWRRLRRMREGSR
jgi:hypothetical protein